MKITLVQDLQALESEWEQLQAQSAADSIFSTWTWCDVWWRHFHNEGQLFLLTAHDDDGQLIGIAPLMRTNGVLKQIRFIGSSAPVEHFDFIIQHGREAEVIKAFMEELQRHGWDVLRLDNILPHSPSLPALLEGMTFEQSEGHVAPYIELPDSLDTLLTRQSKRTREKHRRYRRKIDKDFEGRWSCVTAQTSFEIDAAFAELVKIHQAHWVSRDEAGAFADARMTDFYRDLAHRFAACGWLRMYRLCADDQSVSLDFAFIYRDRFYHFINGTDFQAPVESPGIVLHTCMIEDSIAAGVREYDFMWGEESYKYDWGAQRRADQTLIYHATLRAKLLRTIKAGKAWLKSKQPDV